MYSSYVIFRTNSEQPCGQRLSSRMSVFDDFGPLDERIQVIYQGIDRFVVLSNVDFVDESWTVYVALADKGRWWRTTRGAKEVEHITVNNSFESTRHMLSTWPRDQMRLHLHGKG